MRKTIEEARKELLALREQYRRVFRTTDGQAVLEDLQRAAQAGKDLRPAAGQPLDPYQAVWNEGARASVRRITSMLKEDGDE